MSTRILVIDDDPGIRRVLERGLQYEGYLVETAGDGEAGVRALRDRTPDLVILDVMLPGVDGIEVLRRVRQAGDAVPVILLTARDHPEDQVAGLEGGADDYVTKPFSPRELVARIQALMRRPRTSALTRSTADEPVREFGDLRVDPGGREVWVGGRPVELTPTEFDLLAVLSARPRLAFSRGQLIAEVWGESWRGDERLVDVHIGHLRRKLGDDPSNARYVRTVRGVGYRMGEGQ
jgi:DNA-binding response OmpR family regulator